jgi:hypothetical protein
LGLISRVTEHATNIWSDQKPAAVACETCQIANVDAFGNQHRLHTVFPDFPNQFVTAGNVAIVFKSAGLRHVYHQEMRVKSEKIQRQNCRRSRELIKAQQLVKKTIADASDCSK